MWKYIELLYFRARVWSIFFPPENWGTGACSIGGRRTTPSWRWIPRRWSFHPTTPMLTYGASSSQSLWPHPCPSWWAMIYSTWRPWSSSWCRTVNLTSRRSTASAGWTRKFLDVFGGCVNFLEVVGEFLPPMVWLDHLILLAPEPRHAERLQAS